ncbi:MAG: hypothetical protein HETSPECPRED_002455 [Heterodermia speciosa]|uniref:Uncharacterized protein n=1 Tax=Heterodermia speciosa TaxID=116794 RepID=A0A8H3J4L6_9LECA|nr:MAG: hypothetical protein HETSPECPRED_002455 [Heterodermia speciosa]
MANPAEEFDALLNRVMVHPPGWRSVYEIRPNRFNGVDIRLTFGGPTVSYNTNEQRVIQTYKNTSNWPSSRVSEVLSDLRPEANREPFDVPEVHVDLLSNIIMHHIRHHPPAENAHWYKVNLRHGMSERRRVNNEMVPPLQQSAQNPRDRQAIANTRSAPQAPATQSPAPQGRPRRAPAPRPTESPVAQPPVTYQPLSHQPSPYEPAARQASAPQPTATREAPEAGTRHISPPQPSESRGPGKRAASGSPGSSSTDVSSPSERVLHNSSRRPPKRGG